MSPYCGGQFVFLVEVDGVLCEVRTVPREDMFQCAEGYYLPCIYSTFVIPWHYTGRNNAENLHC